MFTVGSNKNLELILSALGVVHIVHNTLQTAVDGLPTKIEALVKVYKYFHIYTISDSIKGILQICRCGIQITSPAWKYKISFSVADSQKNFKFIRRTEIIFLCAKELFTCNARFF